MRIGVIVPLTRQPNATAVPSWAEIRDFARHAESLGLASLWVFDHLYSGRADMEPEPVHEAWSTQAALAAVTSRIELGQLVTCTAFRHPGVLAKTAVTADDISGGRLTLGLGAGWYDREYQDFGFPTDFRGSRFAEALDVALPLLRGETAIVKGRFYQVDGARLRPAPGRRIPILIAGDGPRMRRLVARHADAWNTAWYAAPNDRLTDRIADMKATLDAAGRGHSTLRWTVGMQGGDGSVTDLAATIEDFAKLRIGDVGIDDLIVNLRPATAASLNQLAEAAAGRLG